jgi:hypothetical protein
MNYNESVADIRKRTDASLTAEHFALTSRCLVIEAELRRRNPNREA